YVERRTMQVFRKLEDIPADFGRTVLSVGNFDGVHRAHIHVINEMVRRAQQQHAKSIAVTFEPHPMRILRPDAGLKLLTPTLEKLRLLEGTDLVCRLLLEKKKTTSTIASSRLSQQTAATTHKTIPALTRIR